MINLKPCPKCGSSKTVVEENIQYHYENGVFVSAGNDDVEIRCEECGYSQKARTPISAVKVWNERVSDDVKAG